MAWPVLDNFNDANNTQLSGSGVSHTSGIGTRASDSGSNLTLSSGNIATSNVVRVHDGAAYSEAGLIPPPFIYNDTSGVLQNDQVTGVYKFFTSSNQIFIALTIHRYYQLRYYFVNNGSFVAGNWYIVDSINQNASISFSDPGRFTFGSVGSPIIHTINYKLTGLAPSTTGFTAEVIVNGVTLGWAPNFISTYPVGNLYSIGWSLYGTSTTTEGIHLSSFQHGLSNPLPTAAEITGPATVGVAIATPNDYSVRGLVGDTNNMGVFRLTLSPSGSVYGSSSTFTLSDGGSGTFSGSDVVGNVLTLSSGLNHANFIYTPSSSGSKTITATPGGAAVSLPAPTLGVTCSSKVIILDGDSRTDSKGGNTSTSIYYQNPYRWAHHLQRRLIDSAAVYNFAVSGQQVTNQLADISTEIVPKINAAIGAGGTVTYVNWSAGNSVSAISLANMSLTPTQVGQQIAAEIQTLCQTVKNAGAKVIVFTDARRKNNMGIPYGFATWQGVRDETNFNLALDACNAVIRLNWKNYADLIFDWGSDERNLNPQYNSGIFEDGTHLYVGDVNTPSHPQAFGSSDVAESVFALWRLLELGGGSSGASNNSFVFGS